MRNEIRIYRDILGFESGFLLFLLKLRIMKIPRIALEHIRARMHSGKAILIFGPRQAGKTTLLHALLPNADDALWLNGDLAAHHRMLEEPTPERFRMLMQGRSVLCIDEAQRIADIGLKLKILVDGLPDVQVIATGSSSFELSNRINEPLTGRKWEFRLYPLSFSEMARYSSVVSEQDAIRHRLVFGYYPEIVSHPGDEVARLSLLADSYLYKDILSWERVLKPQKINLLLQALAYQIGAQVSYNELAQICGIDAKTVERYIDLLEKAFVVFRLGSFSRNLRNELKSSRKVYFFDNGIRNAVIGRFDPLELRDDVGALWENFVVAERIKRNAYAAPGRRSYFWKTTKQHEIDYVEESEGTISAFECKWRSSKEVKPPSSFTKAYPKASFSTIRPDNAFEFLL